MRESETTVCQIPVTPKPFNQFLRDLNRSRATGWRWRQQGVINVVNFFGRPFVMPEEIARFNERVAAGEFARELNGAAKDSADLKKERKRAQAN